MPIHSDTLILKTHPTELCVAPSALPRAPSGHGRCSKYEGSSGCRERDPTRRHRPMMVPQSQPPEAIVGRAGSSRDMWFHHPSQALPLTATVPRLPNGMERKAGRAYRSVLDLVVATCTAALVGAMSVVPPDPRRVAGVVPSVSRPCPDVICTGESRRRQRSDVRPVRA